MIQFVLQGTRTDDSVCVAGTRTDDSVCVAGN